MYKNLTVYGVVVLISICSAAVQAGAKTTAGPLEIDPALLSTLVPAGR